MTKREMIIAAINFEKTDKVPHNITFTQQMLDKMNTFAGCSNYYDVVDNHIAECYPDKPQVEIRPGFFKDEYGVVWDKTGADKDIGMVEEYILEDAENLDDYELPEVDEDYIRRQIETMMSTAGDKFRLVCLGFSLFERAWTLRGMENFLCDMIIDPEFADELLDRITDRNLRILDIVLEYDVDGVYFGDDWGQQKGLIMGPVHWRRFIKPRLQKLYGKVRDAGKYVVQHSCGDVRDVMEDLHEIGLNVYQTFQPEIYGLDYAEKIYGKICIWGGISTQRDLPYKTPEEVKDITKELMKAFSKGGLIASPTHSVPGDVPPENIDAMLQVFKNQ